MKVEVVSMRELQQQLKSVVARVERGETVGLTKRRQLVAHIVPAHRSQPVAPWPDLAKRAQGVFGNRMVRPSPSDELIADRGER
jgi:antitoxin (DNA-binding transcriptional repressor) of toxin-antitoxin stability system